MVKKLKQNKVLFVGLLFVITMIPAIVFGAFGDDIKLQVTENSGNVDDKFIGVYELTDTPGKYSHITTDVNLVNLSGTFTIQDATNGAPQDAYESGTFISVYNATSTYTGSVEVAEYTGGTLVVPSTADDELLSNLSNQLGDVGTLEIIAIILAIPFLFYVVDRLRDLFPGD